MAESDYALDSEEPKASAGEVESLAREIFDYLSTGGDMCVCQISTGLVTPIAHIKQALALLEARLLVERHEDHDESFPWSEDEVPYGLPRFRFSRSRSVGGKA